MALETEVHRTRRERKGAVTHTVDKTKKETA